MGDSCYRPQADINGNRRIDLADLNAIQQGVLQRPLTLFDRSQLPEAGLLLWLDAATDPVIGEADAVSAWGAVAEQTVAAQRPIWSPGIFDGHPGILFDGGQTLRLSMPRAAGDNTTRAIVLRTGPDVVTPQVIWDGDVRIALADGRLNLTLPMVERADASAALAETLAPDTAYLLMLRQNNGVLRAELNGVDLGSLPLPKAGRQADVIVLGGARAAAAGDTGATRGARPATDTFIGAVGAIVWYEAPLNVEDDRLLMLLLADQFGVELLRAAEGDNRERNSAPVAIATPLPAAMPAAAATLTATEATALAPAPTPVTRDGVQPPSALIIEPISVQGRAAAPAAGVLRETWLAVAGKRVQDLRALSAFPATPANSDYLTNFEAPQNWADNYGTRLRAYVQAPVDGEYLFWIASDDNGELWLSSDHNPTNAVRIADVPGHTNSRQWERYASQRSQPVTLQAGRWYYIEALQKEAGGSDHVAVAWQIPGDARQVISGDYLVPFGQTVPYTQTVVTSIQPAFGPVEGGTVVTVTGALFDAGALPQVDFAGVSCGDVTVIDSVTLTCNTPPNARGPVTLTVTTDVGSATLAAGFDYTWGTGNIEYDVWDDVKGKDIDQLTSDPRWPDAPTDGSYLATFEAPARGKDYGSRLRGYLLAPVSGDYVFWIAGDDQSELWLSSDHDPDAAQKIAYVSGHTAAREWDRYPEQRALTVTLRADTFYYIEARHKQAGGDDHVAVAWRTPGMAHTDAPQILPAAVIAPFDAGLPLRVLTVSRVWPNFGTVAGGTPITVYGGPFDAATPPQIDLGQRPCRDVTVISPIAATCTTPPAGTLGNVDVTLTTATASATLNAGFEYNEGTGFISYQWWTGISGSAIANLTGAPDYPDNPSGSEPLLRFETPVNWGNHYGSRLRGYLRPPVDGDYVFWIAGDDNSELWLSDSLKPADAQRIAHVPGHTDVRQWDKYSAQRSITLTLRADNWYYIEALHKEAGGNDHLAPAWQIPGGQRDVIDGRFVAPFDGGVPLRSLTALRVTPDRGIYSGGQVVTILGGPFDPADPPQVTFKGRTCTDLSVLSTIELTCITPPNGLGAADVTLATATETTVLADGYLYNYGTGRITYQTWRGISGSAVSDLLNTDAYPDNPSTVGYLATLDSPRNIDNNYGTRIHGYLVPPVSGDYVFWIASDDRSELRLSYSGDAADTADPGNATRIAHVPGHTGIQQWEKYAAQRSLTLTLTAGQWYYIDILHKEAGGNDHLSVAWQTPLGARSIIPADALAPIDVPPYMQATEPIRPILECVRPNADGSYTAFFGYRNDNAVAVPIAIGDDNRFSPLPIDRGQPALFLPGRHVAVFEVTFSGGNQVWTLRSPNGSRRTSTAGPNGPACVLPPTATPTATATNEPTATITATPTSAPTATPTSAPTATPTDAPTATPTDAPTATPTDAPTATPTSTPTATPTSTPTATPTDAPTATPTSTPPPLPNVTLTGGLSVEEAAGMVDGFTIVRDRAESALTVDLMLGGTAQLNDDYVITPTTITLAAGVLSTTVPVLVIDDGLAERDETLIMALASAPTVYNSEIATATFTIVDNDPVLGITAEVAAAAEGGGGRPLADPPQ